MESGDVYSKYLLTEGLHVDFLTKVFTSPTFRYEYFLVPKVKLKNTFCSQPKRNCSKAGQTFLAKNKKCFMKISGQFFLRESDGIRFDKI